MIPILRNPGFVPLPSKPELIEEAAMAVQMGKSQRAASRAIYDRYYRTKFEDNDSETRENRIHDLSKLIRKWIAARRPKTPII